DRLLELAVGPARLDRQRLLVRLVHDPLRDREQRLIGPLLVLRRSGRAQNEHEPHSERVEAAHRGDSSNGRSCCHPTRPAPPRRGNVGERGRRQMTPDCSGLPAPGRTRAANEDQFLVADLDVPARVVGSSIPAGELGFLGGRLLAVADGLGGHNGGERASALAVSAAARHLVEVLARAPDFPDPDYLAESAIREAVEVAGAEVEAAALADPNLGGMGTTLTLGLVRWPRLHVAHAGDSRVSVLRGGQLWQLTRDHTYA